MGEGDPLINYRFRLKFGLNSIKYNKSSKCNKNGVKVDEDLDVPKNRLYKNESLKMEYCGL